MTPLQKLTIAHAALKRIAAYDPPERFERRSEKDWGLPSEEAISMAYENVLMEARQALKAIGRMPRAPGGGQGGEG